MKFLWEQTTVNPGFGRRYSDVLLPYCTYLCTCLAIRKLLKIKQ